LRNSIIQRTERTTLKRVPENGSFDRATIYQILDEAFLCHVGFITDGQPFVIPTGYARLGDDLLLHGSAASRMLRAMASGIDVCVTVTLLDGLVLARSIFHHSMNYRSVMIFGKAKVISDGMEKLGALRALTEHIVPQRWSEARPPNEQELKATTVLVLPLQEASAKVRTGDPVDNVEDHALDIWAGVIPLRLSAGSPVVDGKLRPEISIPPSVADYKRQNC
jgi:uncharacterized protein